MMDFCRRSPDLEMKISSVCFAHFKDVLVEQHKFIKLLCRVY